MNEKFSKSAKVEKFTNMLGIAVRLIVIDPLLNITSTTFSCNLTTLAMLSCFAWLKKPAIHRPPTKCLKLKWPLLPSIHHMRSMCDYFVTILCTCLKNAFNNIHVNINIDFWSLLYICSNIKISQFPCSVSIRWECDVEYINKQWWACHRYHETV